MTEVLSVLFGKKKPKAPVPAPRKLSLPSNGTDKDGFVIVGNSEFVQHASANGDARNNNMYPPVYQNQAQSNDCETLFSLLKIQSSDSISSMTVTGPPSRPLRPAPPIPAPRGPTYGLRPTNAPMDTQTSSGYYLSSVPFQISKSCGGGMNVQYLKADVSEAISRVKRPNVNDYEYSFNLELQVIDEANANRKA